MGAPVIGLNDSGGARISGRCSVAGRYADIFLRQPPLQRRGAADFPRSNGPLRRPAPSIPRITDFVLMVDKTSYMFITGPDVIKNPSPTKMSPKIMLGGAMTHTKPQA